MTHFRLSNYWKPTPAKAAFIGDLISTIVGTLSATAFALSSPTVGIVLVGLTVLGQLIPKFISSSNPFSKFYVVEKNEIVEKSPEEVKEVIESNNDTIKS